MENKVIVRANSHRSYEKLFRLVGGKDNAPAYYPVENFFSDNSKGYYRISLEYLEGALKIKGISKPRQQDMSHYVKCWNF
jgi:hypothetical protein